MSSWDRGGYGYGWAPKQTVGMRRAEAARKIADAARRGTPLAPVEVAGRKIAETFWGKAWCDNLERYQDFAHRLGRGRSYVRSGSVIHLEVAAGTIRAVVSGSELYEIAITIDAVAKPAWRAIQTACTGSIGSRVDLLSGRLSDPVMERLCADRTGLFPAPSAITFTCSCPDHAIMCKHVAAVMYGVGARLDHTPELLFTLRRVSADELIASALSALPTAAPAARALAPEGLAALFGIELADAPARPPATRAAKKRPAAKSRVAATPAVKKRAATKRSVVAKKKPVVTKKTAGRAR